MVMVNSLKNMNLVIRHEYKCRLTDSVNEFNSFEALLDYQTKTPE